jgi:hypothetical protein
MFVKVLHNIVLAVLVAIAQMELPKVAHHSVLEISYARMRMNCNETSSLV